MGEGQTRRRSLSPHVLGDFEQDRQDTVSRQDMQSGWLPLGDQRAKDLLDRNLDESEPRRAIRRLHRALRYGRDGIQACKAFQDLGYRYEELGNNRLAILYYTRALRLSLDLNTLPLPILYWRGRVYLRSGDQESARRDFGWAVELDDAATWFPEEYALARSVRDAEQQ